MCIRRSFEEDGRWINSNNSCQHAQLIAVLSLSAVIFILIISSNFRFVLAVVFSFGVALAKFSQTTYTVVRVAVDYFVKMLSHSFFKYVYVNFTVFFKSTPNEILIMLLIRLHRLELAHKCRYGIVFFKLCL